MQFMNYEGYDDDKDGEKKKEGRRKAVGANLHV